MKQFWKKNEVGVIILLYFKTSFYNNSNQGIVLTEERHLDQWNRIKNPEIDSYTQLNLDRRAKAI